MLFRSCFFLLLCYGAQDEDPPETILPDLSDIPNISEPHVPFINPLDLGQIIQRRPMMNNPQDVAVRRQPDASVDMDRKPDSPLEHSRTRLEVVRPDFPRGPKKFDIGKDDSVSSIERSRMNLEQEDDWFFQPPEGIIQPIPGSVASGPLPHSDHADDDMPSANVSPGVHHRPVLGLDKSGLSSEGSTVYYPPATKEARRTVTIQEPPQQTPELPVIERNDSRHLPLEDSRHSSQETIEYLETMPPAVQPQQQRIETQQPFQWTNRPHSDLVQQETFSNHH